MMCQAGAMRGQASARRADRRWGSRRGNAMLEFALSSMILIYVFTGVFQFGYSMYLYNELEAGVRAGIRYASLAGISNSADSSIPPAYSTAVQNMVVYGTPSPVQNQTPVIKGLTPGVVTVGVNFDSGHVPTDVSVKISTYSVDAIFKTFTFANKPVLKMPYFGKYCSNGVTC
jgi:Flp pilus assembly protein TadG